MRTNAIAPTTNPMNAKNAIFFKYQKKPKLTGHGDLYYEGKEFEIDMKHRKAGTLSAELLGLLGMEEGGPPPWLINMQVHILALTFPWLFA